MADNKTDEITLTWQLTCRDCKQDFEVEVPRGPREEKELRCPSCKGQDLERIEAASVDAGPACGG